MLMITSSVRVLDRIHGAAADFRPRIALHSVLVEVVSGLQDWLVHTSTPCHNANDSTAC